MEFWETPVYDDDIFKMVVRFAFDLVFLALVVTLAIYPNERKREFVFTSVMMNIMVFFICFTLKKMDLGLGMALGLFAIFGVLRYRTDSIRPKEMTYLFIVIGIAVVNSLSNKKTSYSELIAVNCLVVAGTVVMEFFHRRDRLYQHTVNYDRVELLRPENRAELLQDMKDRTGFDVTKVAIKNLDLRKSAASVTIWYHDPNRNGDVVPRAQNSDVQVQHEADSSEEQQASAGEDPENGASE